MSKSLGNFFRLQDLLSQGHSPEAIRYLLLSVHYRKQLNFTMDGLRQAQSSIQRLEDFMLRAKEIANAEEPSAAFTAEVQAARDEIYGRDGRGLKHIGRSCRHLRFRPPRVPERQPECLSGGDARAAIDFLKEIDGIFNILRAQPEILDEEIAQQIEARQAARGAAISPKPTESASRSWPKASSWRTPAKASAGNASRDSRRGVSPRRIPIDLLSYAARRRVLYKFLK